MNEKIKDILVGLILGDGHLTEFSGNSRQSSLLMKSDNKNVAYLKWLHKQLTPLGVSELKPKKNYHQHQFRTKWSKDIGQLRSLFYPRGKKTVPRNINSLLVRPITVAIWYQDDGTLDCRSKYHYNALFATHCFSFDECVLLAETLKTNFDLDVSVCKSHMRGKTRYRLYVKSKSMERFINLVKPFINPSFKYKIRKVNSQQQR